MCCALGIVYHTRNYTTISTSVHTMQLTATNNMYTRTAKQREPTAEEYVRSR